MVSLFDSKGRRWTAHYSYNARFGWKWKANWTTWEVGSGQYFTTKEEAAHDAELTLKARDHVVHQMTKGIDAYED